MPEKTPFSTNLQVVLFYRIMSHLSTCATEKKRLFFALPLDGTAFIMYHKNRRKKTTKDPHKKGENAMQNVFSGEILNITPFKQGFVFAAKGTDREDDKVVQPYQTRGLPQGQIRL